MISYQLKHGILVGNLHTWLHECAKTVEKQAKILCNLHNIFAYKTSKKRRFCGGRVTRFGVSRTQSSSRCSCHLPHPARLHFANWNTRQCRGCNISSPMRNAIFRSYKLWLDVFRVCTWACKCNASGRNSEKERGTICCRIDRSCNARKPSEHAGRITGRLHGNPWQTQSE